jgi:hypothetical protein
VTTCLPTDAACTAAQTWASKWLVVAEDSHPSKLRLSQSWKTKVCEAVAHPQVPCSPKMMSKVGYIIWSFRGLIDWTFFELNQFYLLWNPSSLQEVVVGHWVWVLCHFLPANRVTYIRMHLHPDTGIARNCTCMFVNVFACICMCLHGCACSPSVFVVMCFVMMLFSCLCHKLLHAHTYNFINYVVPS